MGSPGAPPGVLDGADGPDGAQQGQQDFVHTVAELDILWLQRAGKELVTEVVELAKRQFLMCRSCRIVSSHPSVTCSLTRAPQPFWVQVTRCVDETDVGLPSSIAIIGFIPRGTLV